MQPLIQSFIYYLIGLINIYTSFKIYEEGDTAYFFTFWSLFLTDKIIILIMALQHTIKSDILDWAFDLFQVGFARQIFSQQFFPFSYFEVVISKVFTHAILGVFQFYFFYISEFLEASNIECYILALIHISFFASIFFAIFLWSNINETKQISKIELFLSIGSNLLTFITFLQFETESQINLGFNYLALIFLNFSCLLYFNKDFDSIIDNLVSILKQIVQCTIFCTNYVTEKDEIFYISQHTTLVMNLGYLNQIFKLFILMKYCLDSIYQSIFGYDIPFPQNYTKASLTALSFIFLISFITYYLKRIFFFAFKVKIYMIEKDSDLDNLNKNIERESLNIKKIFSIMTQRINDDAQQNQKIKEFCKKTCYKQYKYLKKLLKMQAKNIEVQHQDMDNFCACYQQKLASEEYNWLQIFVNSQANYILNRFTKNQITQILSNRYYNGFVYGKVTQFVENYMEDIYRYKNLVFKQNILQVLSFIRQQYTIMQNCPKQILYDLYASNLECV